MALKLNRAPTPLVDTQVAFNAARAVMAAAELGVYEAVGKTWKSSDEVATLCNTKPESTRQLLDCLVGIGYLKWADGKYALKSRYHKWLLKGSDSNVIGKLRFQIIEWDWMAKLEDYVRTGTTIDLHKSTTDREWRLYQEGMRDLSVNAAKELANKIPIRRGASQMLDIGGSHGLFSIALCKRHEGLRSTILELPDAIESASSIAKRYEGSENVSYKAGNALDDDLGSGEYDLVMINNVVHHFTADQNRTLAVKAARALKQGGLYAIGEFIRSDKPGAGGLVGSTSGLYFSLTSASGTWSISEMQSWQTNAGLKIEKPIAAITIPGWKMVMARKARTGIH